MKIQKSKEGSRSPWIFRDRLSDLHAKNLGLTPIIDPNHSASNNATQLEGLENLAGAVVGGVDGGLLRADVVRPDGGASVLGSLGDKAAAGKEINEG